MGWRREGGRGEGGTKSLIKFSFFCEWRGGGGGGRDQGVCRGRAKNFQKNFHCLL